MRHADRGIRQKLCALITTYLIPVHNVMRHLIHLVDLQGKVTNETWWLQMSHALYGQITICTSLISDTCSKLIPDTCSFQECPIKFLPTLSPLSFPCDRTLLSMTSLPKGTQNWALISLIIRLAMFETSVDEMFPSNSARIVSPGLWDLALGFILWILSVLLINSRPMAHKQEGSGRG